MEFFGAILFGLLLLGFVAVMVWLWDGWITIGAGWILVFIGIGLMFLLFSTLAVIAAVFVIGALTAFIFAGLE